MRENTAHALAENESFSMKDTSITKVTSAFSPQGPSGQKYLASGIHVSMRMWENEEPGKAKAETSRPYETVGYAIKGCAELRVEGQTVILNAGDSWAVPKGAKHSYKIIETFTAIEATSPPAQVHDREE